MKKTNKKNTTILKNQQFKLGSIINPIIEPIVAPVISYDSMISHEFSQETEIAPVFESIIAPVITHVNSNETNTIKTTESILNPIDFVFGIIIEKPDSPLKNVLDQNDYNKIHNTDTNTNTNDYLKQIYPPLMQNNSNSLLSRNLEEQLYTNNDIKLKIDKLSENQMCEIFKIIKNNKEKYSTNKNGIFINLSTLKKITITEICNFLSFCDNNNIIFDNEEKTRDIYREMLL